MVANSIGSCSFCLAQMFSSVQPWMPLAAQKKSLWFLMYDSGVFSQISEQQLEQKLHSLADWSLQCTVCSLPSAKGFQNPHFIWLLRCTEDCQRTQPMSSHTAESTHDSGLPGDAAPWQSRRADCVVLAVLRATAPSKRPAPSLLCRSCGELPDTSLAGKKWSTVWKNWVLQLLLYSTAQSSNLGPHHGLHEPV